MILELTTIAWMAGILVLMAAYAIIAAIGVSRRKKPRT